MVVGIVMLLARPGSARLPPCRHGQHPARVWTACVADV